MDLANFLLLHLQKQTWIWTSHDWLWSDIIGLKMCFWNTVKNISLPMNAPIESCCNALFHGVKHTVYNFKPHMWTCRYMHAYMHQCEIGSYIQERGHMYYTILTGSSQQLSLLRTANEVNYNWSWESKKGRIGVLHTQILHASCIHNLSLLKNGAKKTNAFYEMQASSKKGWSKVYN